MAKRNLGNIYRMTNTRWLDKDGHEVELPMSIQFQPEPKSKPLNNGEPFVVDLREWAAMLTFTITLDMREYAARLWAEKMVSGTIEMMKRLRG